MRINWKVRAKNPIFWLTIIPAIATCAYTVAGCFGVVPSVSQEELLDAVKAVVTALTVLGVLVDPTTKGAGDSENALTYEEPR